MSPITDSVNHTRAVSLMQLRSQYCQAVQRTTSAYIHGCSYHNITMGGRWGANTTSDATLLSSTTAAMQLTMRACTRAGVIYASLLVTGGATKDLVMSFSTALYLSTSAAVHCAVSVMRRL